MTAPVVMVIGRGTATATAATSSPVPASSTAAAASLVGGSADLEDFVFERNDDGVFARKRRCADDGPATGGEVVAFDCLIQ